MGAMKETLNMDNVQLYILGWEVSNIGNQLARVQALRKALHEQGMSLTIPSGELSALGGMHINEKRYSLSFEALDFFGGRNLKAESGRSLAPMAVVVDHACHMIMLAL